MGIIRNPILESFKKVAELGSVHAAARAMHLTQTAITKRIKALEEDLKITLFLRSRKGMRLTDDGTALLQYCITIEEIEGSFLSQISGKTRSDIQLTIVGPTSAISSRIVANCEKLYAKYPNLRLHLRSDDHSNLVDLVRSGKADLAVVSPDLVPNEMDSKVLKPDRYFLVGSPKWKGRQLSEILKTERVIDFYEDDPTTRNYLKKFGLTSQMRKDRIFVNENAALIHLFAIGAGYGTLTEYVARPYLDSAKLIALNRGQTMEDPLALVWYPRPQKADYFANLIQAIF